VTSHKNSHYDRTNVDNVYVQLMDQSSAQLDEVCVFLLESAGLTQRRKWSTCKIDINLEFVYRNMKSIS